MLKLQYVSWERLSDPEIIKFCFLYQILSTKFVLTKDNPQGFSSLSSDCKERPNESLHLVIDSLLHLCACTDFTDYLVEIRYWTTEFDTTWRMIYTKFLLTTANDQF